jgi:hypothetical protein
MMWFPYLEEVPMLGHAGKEALKQFDWMCERVQPIEITFVCIVSAHGHVDLVDEAIRCYVLLITVSMISAKLECYTCMEPSWPCRPSTWAEKGASSVCANLAGEGLLKFDEPKPAPAGLHYSEWDEFRS